MIENFAKYKWSSLLWKFANYGRKKFYNIGPWSDAFSWRKASTGSFLDFRWQLSTVTSQPTADEIVELLSKKTFLFTSSANFTSVIKSVQVESKRVCHCQPLLA